MTMYEIINPKINEPQLSTKYYANLNRAIKDLFNNIIPTTIPNVTNIQVTRTNVLNQELDYTDCRQITVTTPVETIEFIIRRHPFTKAKNCPEAYTVIAPFNTINEFTYGAGNYGIDYYHDPNKLLDYLLTVVIPTTAKQLDFNIEKLELIDLKKEFQPVYARNRIKSIKLTIDKCSTPRYYTIQKVRFWRNEL